MKICLASNLYPPDVIGGAETMVGHIARGLRGAGCEVTVVTTMPRARAGSEIRDGITVHRIPTGNLYWPGDAGRRPLALKPLWHAIDLWNLSVYRRLRRILANEKFDVVHTHNLGGLSTAVWSAAAASGVPIVHTLHDYALTCVRSLRMTPAGRICSSPCLPCGMRGRWLRRMSHLVAAVAAPSQFVLDRHLELGFFPSARAALTRWGLPDLPAWSGPPAPRPLVRFVFLGLLRAHKGVRVMLDAFRRVRSRNARLDIAGAGELARDCEAAAVVDDRISFHGYVSGEAKTQLLQAGHALLLPSISWEVSGLAILEAFAHGMPVIGSRIGGIPELIDEGVTGFLIEPGDAEALAARIETLSADAESIRRLRPGCRTRAETLTLSATVGPLLDLYEKVRRN